MRTRSLALAAILAVLAGCTKVGSGGPGEGRHPYTEPHVLRYATSEDIVGLNPLIVTQAVVSYMAQMTGAWLVKTDAQGNPTIPELITEIPTQKNGGISADGKTITWHLRKGVKWSDGVPFTADDVVFSTNQVNNPANNVVSRDGWDQIVSVGEPDKYTVVYHLKRPYSSYLVTFFSSAGANPDVMPKHLLQNYPNLNNVPYNSNPIGIGPFKYQEWKRADSVTMVPNPLYWRGTPKLQKIVYKLISDRNTVLEQIKSYELDLWIPVAPHYVPQLKVPGVQISMTPSFTFDHLDFNMSRPVLQDPAVREAIRYATDRKALNDKVRNGLYILNESVVPTASIYHEDLPTVPFDIAKANQILDAAGWRRGPDGIRTKNGLKLNLDFASSSGSPDTDTQIELMRGWWKQIGISLTVKHYNTALLFATIQQHGIVYGSHFDVINFGWGGDPNQDLSNLYRCDRFPPDGQNDPRYCNPAASQAMLASQTTYDQAIRMRLLRTIQEDIYKDIPTIILDDRREIYAYNSDLKNWHPNPIAPFDDMLNVDI